MNSNQPTWTNERRKLSDLIPWEPNPRQIKDKQAERLIESFEDFGQVEPIAIGPDNGIYNGHQRVKTLAAKYGMDYEVDVRVSSRPLTEKEREKLTVFLHRGATGEWDFEELANWNMNDLLTWGFEESDFPFDVAPLVGEGESSGIDEIKSQWAIMITCRDESEQLSLLEQFEGEGLTCKALIS